MSRPSKSKLFTKRISVHPPEADAVADAFGDAQQLSQANLDTINKISENLDRNWEGNRKNIFLEELRITIDRIRNILLPQLRMWEKNYREYMVEKDFVEDVKE